MKREIPNQNNVSSMATKLISDKAEGRGQEAEGYIFRSHHE